jgi:hypothetical protein
MLSTPLACKFVATTLMLAEVNHCASRLQLPINLPVKEQDVRVMVFRPKLPAFGRMDTADFSFSFGKSGRLIFITRLDNGYQAYSTTKKQGQMRTSEFLPQLAGIRPVIDTNGRTELLQIGWRQSTWMFRGWSGNTRRS